MIALAQGNFQRWKMPYLRKNNKHSESYKYDCLQNAFKICLSFTKNAAIKLSTLYEIMF